MRVMDCECGKTLQAANDDDLVEAVRRHIDEEHPDMDMSQEDVEELVSSQAYDAEDA
jgi:predicted small metal-binding protein